MMQMRPLALSFLLLPGVAAADVTPQDVWDNMVAGYGALGFELTATLETSGDTLIANNGIVLLTYPVIGGQATATLPPMTLTALGDGTVQIGTPGTYVSTITADIPEETEPFSVDLTMSVEGLSSIASGNPGDVTYTTDTTSFDLLASNLVVPGEAFDVFEVQFDSDGYASVTQVTVTDSVSITSNALNRAAVTRINVGTEGFRQETTTSSGELETTLAAVMPAETDIMNLAPALRAGMSITGTTRSQGGTSNTKTFESDQLFSEQSQVTGASTGEFGFDAAGIRFSGAGEGGTFNMSGTDLLLPFPIEATFGTFSAKFAFPLLGSETAQSFTYAFGLNDLTVADDLWDLIDPGQGLDRSPLSLTLDLSGDLINSLDLVDPASWEQMENGAMPFEPLSLAINDLAVRALGAVVTGDGSFTFDNSDLQTFNGLPRPEGRAALKGTGINAAIDQLVGAGLLAEQDAMMPRMFMGMFAVAQGDDVLTTEVEINAEGHVLLNGQRVQ